MDYKDDNYEVFSLIDNKKIKRPHESNFMQQKLPTYHPDYLSRYFSFTCLILSIIHLLMASISFYSNYKVREISIDYTLCFDINDYKCYDLINSNDDKGHACQCKIDYLVDSTITGPVYVYYEITNMYQNHRHYSNSFDSFQLSGEQNLYPSTLCESFTYSNNQPIFPCGAVANSYFNDTYQIKNGRGETFYIGRDHISFEPTSSLKFKNPQDLEEIDKRFAKPIDWPYSISKLGNNEQRGLKFEPFQNWMSISPFPTVRKLYGIIKTDIVQGQYTIMIDYNWNSRKFNGKKFLYLTSTSFLGGRNYFLTYLLLLCGIFEIFVGFYSRVISNQYRN